MVPWSAHSCPRIFVYPNLIFGQPWPRIGHGGDLHHPPQLGKSLSSNLDAHHFFPNMDSIQPHWKWQMHHTLRANKPCRSLAWSSLWRKKAWVGLLSDECWLGSDCTVVHLSNSWVGQVGLLRIHQKFSHKVVLDTLWDIHHPPLVGKELSSILVDGDGILLESSIARILG